MYSRFTPGPDGVYRRQSIASPPAPPQEPPQTPQISAPPAPPAPTPSLKQRISALLPGDLDVGDVLVLLVGILLLIDAEEDLQTILITLAAFFFL